MSKEENVLRIKLSEPSAKLVKQMMASLKMEASHISVNPSKLVDWIVREYQSKYFERDKKRITDSHFNKKSYLIELLKNMDANEELSEKLSDMAIRLRETKTQTKQKMEKDESKHSG